MVVDHSKNKFVGLTMMFVMWGLLCQGLAFMETALFVSNRMRFIASNVNSEKYTLHTKCSGVGTTGAPGAGAPL